ncbi:MAG: glycosyl transferase family 2, partial [Bacteroidota bacterium]
MEQFILFAYIFALSILFIFGAHRFVMVYHYYKHRHEQEIEPALTDTPPVTIQLPIFNEMYVVRRLIDASCAIDYPKDRLEIQVLDDSTDETVDLVESIVKEKQNLGFTIHHVRR